MRVAIIGDGLSALVSAAHLAHLGTEIFWVQGSGTKILFPLSSVERGKSMELLAQLGDDYSIDLGSPMEGLFVREARNKAFRNPPWAESFDPETRKNILDECLAPGESSMVPLYEGRFESLELRDFEKMLREKVLALPHVRRMEGIPLTEVTCLSQKRSWKLVFGHLAKPIDVDVLLWCDRFEDLKKLKIKTSGLNRHFKPVSVLQYELKHRLPLGGSMQESFSIPLQKEADEKEQKTIWGSFSSEGTESVWTLLLDAGEIEDNHLIVKRLRRMRQALNKAFGEEFLGQPGAEFTSTIVQERVRFEENFFASKGHRTDSAWIKVQRGSFQGSSSFLVLTDLFGPTESLLQCEESFEVLDEILGSKHEFLDRSSPTA